MNKILNNIGWLIFDKMLILILQFFVGVKIVNYYGSLNYGEYSYIMALVAFSSILFELINPRIPKKYYNEKNYNKIVYNITLFRNVIAIILFLLALVSRIFIKMELNYYLMLVFLSLDNIFITSTLGIENYYEYKLESKKIVISNNVLKIIFYSLQYFGMLLNFSIIMIPIVRCIGSFIRMCMLKYSYKKTYGIKEKKEIDLILIKKIINESFFLWLSYVAVLVYLQLDKIMLGIMISSKVVGIYAIGVSLSQMLEIAIGPIQTSIYPKMLDLYNKDYKEYLKFYSKVNFIITQIYLWGIVVSIFIVIKLFKYVYTPEYNQAIYVYIILTITILMKANGSLQTVHLTIKKITQKIFIKTFLALIINIILNYIFIKKYGILGAAIATSITQILALFIFDFFIKEYREHAFIQLKSFDMFGMWKIFGKEIKKI